MKHNWLQRTLSAILAFVLVLGYVPVRAQAQDPETSVSNDVTLEGETSFGNLLTNTVNESQSHESAQSYDARICDLVIEGTTATVEYTTPVNANLVVAIYDQNSGKMLGSGTVMASPEETIAEVAIEIPVMPYYFSAGAYLLDAQTNDPVSEEFKTDRYTKTMQDILAATVDDFNPELVLNLDSDRTTNFAVFNENTLRADSAGEVTITDNGDGTYTIENAHAQFLAMQPGDTFTYTYPDGTMLIVNAASVRVSGTTVTVTENPDADLSTVFDFVKIETDSYGKKWEYDDSELDEGLTVIPPEEFAELCPDGVSPDSWAGTGESSVNTGFAIDHKVGEDGKEVTIGGSLDFGLTLTLDIYYLDEYLSVSMKCASAIKLSLNISGSVEMERKIGGYKLSLGYGLFGRVQPKLKLEASAELSGYTEIKASIGFAYDNATGGWENISSPTTASCGVELEGTLAAGVALETGICFITEKLLDFSEEIYIGAELQSSDGKELPDGCLHACEKCYAASLNAFGEGSVKLSYLNKYEYTHTVIGIRFKLSDFYYSADSKKMGVGSCPKRAYRVTVQAKLPTGAPYAGGPIVITKDDQPVKEVFLQDKDGKTEKAPVPLTNSQGESEFYLSPGDYTFQAVHNDKTAKADATVKDRPAKVKLEFVDLTLSDTTLSLTEEKNTATLTATLRGTNVTGKCTWTSSDDSVVKVDGGKVEALAPGEATVTAEYKADGETYSAECEVTVTGQEHTFTLSKESMTLQGADTTGTLTAKLDGKTVTGDCEWTSSDEAVATVDGGTVTAVASGSTVITAKYSYFGKEYEKTCAVSVRTDDGTLRLSESSLSMKPNGDTQALTAEFDGQDVTDKCQWTSDSVSVATVSGGTVTPLNAGVATITATYVAYGETITGQCTVVVSEDSGTPGNPGGGTQSGPCGNLTWMYNEDNHVLTISGTGAMPDYGSDSNTPWRDLYIEYLIINKGVTSIGAYAFSGKSIGSIIIPNTVTSIGDYAFSSTVIYGDGNIPGSVVSIGNGAFQGCGLKSLTLSYGVKTIGDEAFAVCYNLTSVTIPGSVTRMGKDVFWSCYNLTSVKIQDGIPSIGKGAFSQCEKLSSVTIPDSIRSIGEYAFYRCSSLTSITIPDSVTTIGESAFNQTGLTSITIPDSVTTIGDAAFYGSSLTSAEIPGSVTSFGQSAFGGCESLTKVTFGEGLTSIGSYAFQSCEKLTSVTIPDSVTTIGEYALSMCGLTSVTLPKSLKTIEAGVLCETHLESIVIPEKVSSIGESAFYNCQKLTSVTIPTSVTTIGGAAFSDCNALKDINYQGTVEQYCGITIWYGNDAFFQATIHCTDGDIAPRPLPEEAADALIPETEAPTEATEETLPEDTEETFPTEPTEETLPEIIEEPELAPEMEEEFLLLEEVADIQWYSAPAGAEMTVEPVLQKLSAFSGTESGKNGVRSVKFTGLEPGEEYVLIVSLIPGSLVPADLLYIDQNNAAADGTLSFTYIPRQDVSAQVQLYGIPAGRTVTLDREHLTMEVGAADEKLTAAVTPEEWAGDLKWSAKNPEGTKIISVNEFGDVTPEAPGTAYAVATVTHGKYTFSARCRVDVTEKRANQEVTGVQLGTTALTTELFRTDYAEFDVILLLDQNKNPVMTADSITPDGAAPEGNGVAVDSAEFVDEKAAAMFDLAVKDDRTLLVVPKQSAIKNPKPVAGKYKSQIRVFVDGEPFVTDTALTLSVKKSMPKLKATALTFNSFYTGQSQAIRITGATATKYVLTKDKTQPEWLDYGKVKDGVLTLTKNPTGRNGNVFVTVTAEGWAKDFDVAVPVKLSYAAPKLKLSASTVTIPTFTGPDDAGYLAGGQWLRLLCSNRKDTLESLKVSDITAPAGWHIQRGEADWFWLQPNPGVTVDPDGIPLKVHFSDTDSVVELPLTVKTKHTPMKIQTSLTSQKINLNSNVEDGFFVNWDVYPQRLDLENYTLKWVVRDAKGNETQALRVEPNYVGRFAVLTTPDTAPGKYSLYLDLADSEGNTVTEESTVVNFTVLNKKSKPSISMKVLDTIDLAFPNPQSRIAFGFKNYYISRIPEFNPDFHIYNAKNQDVTNSFDFRFERPYWVMSPKAGTKAGTYTLKFAEELENAFGNPCSVSCSAKFTVKRTQIKLKLSKTSLSLNKAIGDTAVVDVTCLTKGYDFTKPVAALILPAEKDGQDINLNKPENKLNEPENKEPLTVSWSDGKLTVTANSNAEAGKTYKITLKATKNDPAVTLSVRILDVAVTASLKAKGTIDVVRDSTAITVTPTYKNYMGLSKINPNLTIESSGDKWKTLTDVTSSFAIAKNDNGTYTIAKKPGAAVDTSLKYRAKLTFDGNPNPAYVNLTVKSGTAKLAVSGTPVLYKADRYSRGTFRITTADKTLNPIEKVTSKDARFEVYSYGNGEFAIGFKDNLVPTGKLPTKVTLNVYADGNLTNSVASVTLKLQVR